MQVLHNTVLLEKAVQEAVRRASIPSLQAEASANEKLARATATRRLATGAAIAMVAVGIGLGIFLANRKSSEVAPRSASGSENVAPTPAPANIPDPGSATKPPEKGSLDETSKTPADDRPTIETTNYTIFRTVELSMGSKRWTIDAGHRFLKEDDQQAMNWEAAWCYTTVSHNGLSLQVDLGNRRSRSDLPAIPQVNQTTLDSARMTRFEATALAAKCPWLDGRSFPIDQNALREKLGSNGFQLKEGVLTYSGSITVGFAGQLASYNFDSLVIDSPGGVVDEAIAAGKYLRMRQRSVTVKGECLSACVFVLAGGSFRNADATAHIGVHRFFKDAAADVGDVELGQEKSAEILQYLQSMGIKDALWFTMSKTPSETMKYVDHPTLRDWRLLSAAEVVVSEPPGIFPVEPSSLEQTVPKVDLPEVVTAPKIDPEFVRVVGRDAPGNDMANMPIRDVSELQCQVRCQSNSSCMAATYNASYRACFLKTGAKTLKIFAGAVTYYRSQLRKSIVLD